MSNDTTVVDDAPNSRFLSRQEGGDAELSYRLNGRRLILTHTEVPEVLRRQGIAGRLVRAVVERAEETGETVVPWCPYTRWWLRNHPDIASRVHIDWIDAPRSGGADAPGSEPTAEPRDARPRDDEDGAKQNRRHLTARELPGRQSNRDDNATGRVEDPI